jgi:Pyruvate phosphate dikinase, AMP/ATP-binding domain
MPSPLRTAPGSARARRRRPPRTPRAGAPAARGDHVRREPARVAPELRDAIEAAFGELGDVQVAVRSRACAEDSDAASFAGQQETYLHVRGVRAVLDRVRDCWASFFSERAIFHGSRKGSLDDLGMAVVVQRMVESDVSGVLFTCDPVHNRRDRMVVEAMLGLGEAVVSGQVTPDHYSTATGRSAGRRCTRSRTRSSPHPRAARRARAEQRGGLRPQGRRRPARRTRPPRRRPRAPPGRAAGHRVGAAGRRAVRAPGAAGDDVSEDVLAAPRWCASAACSMTSARGPATSRSSAPAA